MDKIEISKQLMELIGLAEYIETRFPDKSWWDKTQSQLVAKKPALIALKDIVDKPLEEQIREALVEVEEKAQTISEIANNLRNSAELSPQSTEPRYTVDEVVAEFMRRTEKIRKDLFDEYGCQAADDILKKHYDEVVKELRAILTGAATEDAG